MIKKNLYPTLTIFFSSIICLFLVIQFSWKNYEGEINSQIIDSDGKGYYLYLPNTLINNTIRNQEVDDRYIVDSKKGSVNKYFVGTAAAMSPFFFTGYIMAKIMGYKLDGYSLPFQYSISIAAIFYLVLGLIFLSLIIELYKINPIVNSITLIIIVFGTNLLSHSVLIPSMSHVYSWCFISSFIYFIKKLDLTNKSKYLYFSALVFGFIILIRPLNGLIIFIIPFISTSYSDFKNLINQNLKFNRIIISLLILTSVLSVQLIVWYLQTGSFFVWTYKQEGFYFNNPQVWNVLFSFRKGLFIYTPIIFISLFGLIFVFKKNKFHFFSLLFFILILIYFISSWWNWFYGPSFGQRPFVEFYAVFALLLAFLINGIVNKLLKTITLTICFLLIYVNLIQTYQFQYGFISSWDMNFEKYKYIFLKTSSDYRGRLGGNKDILLYKSQPKRILSIKNDFESKNTYTTIDQINIDNINKSKVCDYSDREFNLLIKIPVDSSFLTKRGIFLEVELDRFEIDTFSCSNALFVIEVSNFKNQSYWYNSFRINETPSKFIKEWKTYNYLIEIPKIKSINDVIKIYIWNIKKDSFFIDNLNMEFYSLN